MSSLRFLAEYLPAATGSNNTIAVPAGSLVLTGFAPTVAVSDHKTIAVPAGSLVLTGQVPTVALSDNKTIAVPAGSLLLTGFEPTIAQTANNVIAVDAGSLILTGYPPTITGGVATGADVAVGGGGGRRRRLQEIHYVVIDGEDHRVSSVEEAKEILLKLREVAAKRVQRQTRKAVAKAPEAPAVIPPRATVKIDDYSTVFAQQLQAQVDAANAQVAEQYAQAVAAAQAWQRHKQALDEEDDEIETLVLLGIL